MKKGGEKHLVSDVNESYTTCACNAFCNRIRSPEEFVTVMHNSVNEYGTCEKPNGKRVCVCEWKESENEYIIMLNSSYSFINLHLPNRWLQSILFSSVDPDKVVKSAKMWCLWISGTKNPWLCQNKTKTVPCVFVYMTIVQQHYCGVLCINCVKKSRIVKKTIIQEKFFEFSVKLEERNQEKERKVYWIYCTKLDVHKYKSSWNRVNGKHNKFTDKNDNGDDGSGGGNINDMCVCVKKI